MSSPDPLDSAIPVGSGPGTSVPPGASSAPPPPVSPPPGATPPIATPRAAPSGNDKIWAILSHLSGFIGVPILLPVVVYFAMKDDSLYVAANAREALNFHLSLLIYALCLIPLYFIVIGIPLAILLALTSLILAIIAAVKSGRGECYRYPLTIRLIN